MADIAPLAANSPAAAHAAIAAEVLFPIMYIVTLSFSSKTTRPSSLELFPQELSLSAYKQVLDHPTANPVTFSQLLKE